MNTGPVDLLTYLGFTATGFLIKFFLDHYVRTRHESLRRSIETIERKLSEFYWPLYCRLRRGSVAWKSENLRAHDGSPERTALQKIFDENIIINNHEETRDIIQNNFFHFGGDKQLESALIRLLHHIDIYLSLRHADLPHDPIWVGEPWPDEAEQLLEKKLHKLQTEYDILTRKLGSPI